MQQMHIAGIDLNLAMVLHALLDARSVSRAAQRLGLSQSATSHALARLRHLLDDALFVRHARGLVPTSRALAMAPVLAAALADIERAFFAPAVFDPTTARRRFLVGTSDYVEHVLGPPLLTRLAKTAPGIDVHTRQSPTMLAQMSEGEIDLAVTLSPNVDGGTELRSQPLWQDRIVGVARRGHPILRGKMTVDRYTAARHAIISPRGRAGGLVDDALEKLGRTRRVAFTTQSFLVAPQIVSETDLIITMAARLAHAFARILPLTLFEPPVELPTFTIATFWHARLDADPAHRFLRDEVARIGRTLPAVGPLRKRGSRAGG